MHNLVNARPLFFAPFNAFGRGSGQLIQDTSILQIGGLRLFLIQVATFTLLFLEK